MANVSFVPVDFDPFAGDATTQGPGAATGLTGQGTGTAPQFPGDPDPAATAQTYAKTLPPTLDEAGVRLIPMPHDFDPFAGQPSQTWDSLDAQHPPFQGDPFLPTGETAQPADDSWRTRLHGSVQQGLEDFGMPRTRAQDWADRATGSPLASNSVSAADLVPGLGQALAGNEMLRARDAGNYLSAGMSALGAVPLPPAASAGMRGAMHMGALRGLAERGVPDEVDAAVKAWLHGVPSSPPSPQWGAGGTLVPPTGLAGADAAKIEGMASLLGRPAPPPVAAPPIRPSVASAGIPPEQTAAFSGGLMLGEHKVNPFVGAHGEDLSFPVFNQYPNGVITVHGGTLKPTADNLGPIHSIIVPHPDVNPHWTVRTPGHDTEVATSEQGARDIAQGRFNNDYLTRTDPQSLANFRTQPPGVAAPSAGDLAARSAAAAAPASPPMTRDLLPRSAHHQPYADPFLSEDGRLVDQPSWVPGGHGTDQFALMGRNDNGDVGVTSHSIIKPRPSDNSGAWEVYSTRPWSSTPRFAGNKEEARDIAERRFAIDLDERAPLRQGATPAGQVRERPPAPVVAPQPLRPSQTRYESPIDQHVANLGVTEPEFMDRLFAGRAQGTPEVSRGRYATTVSTVLKDPDTGKSIGTMIRTLYPNHVDHAYFQLAKTEEDNGVSRAMLMSQIPLYQDLGMSHVDVHANIDVGGYSWARYGFVPSQSSWNSLRADVKGRLYDLGHAGLVSVEDARKVAKILDDSNPKAIWEIADLSQLVPQPEGKPKTLGKRLLLGTDWSGKLDLKDAETMKRFGDYVGQPPRAPRPLSEGQNPGTMMPAGSGPAGGQAVTQSAIPVGTIEMFNNPALTRYPANNPDYGWFDHGDGVLSLQPKVNPGPFYNDDVVATVSQRDDGNLHLVRRSPNGNTNHYSRTLDDAIAAGNNFHAGREP